MMPLFWCNCTTINNVVVSIKNSSAFSPDIILLLLLNLLLIINTTIGEHNSIKSHEEFCPYRLNFQFPPKRFDNSPPGLGGCSEDLDAFRVFLNTCLRKKSVVGEPN